MPRDRTSHRSRGRVLHRGERASACNQGCVRPHNHEYGTYPSMSEHSVRRVCFSTCGQPATQERVVKAGVDVGADRDRGDLGGAGRGLVQRVGWWRRPRNTANSPAVTTTPPISRERPAQSASRPNYPASEPHPMAFRVPSRDALMRINSISGGGKSGDQDVSLSFGRAAAQLLVELAYEVTNIDPLFESPVVSGSHPPTSRCAVLQDESIGS